MRARMPISYIPCTPLPSWLLLSRHRGAEHAPCLPAPSLPTAAHASHPLLPLGILGEDPIYGLTKRCLRCNRTLSLFGFSPFEVGSRYFVRRAVDVRCQSRWRTMMETKAARVEKVAEIVTSEPLLLSRRDGVRCRRGAVHVIANTSAWITNC